MKTTGIILTLVCGFLLILSSSIGIVGTYKYEKEFLSYWSLADKSSTIVDKAKNIDLFVCALEKGGFEGKYNAVILTTPDNSFDQNLKAIKSFQLRLHEIENMNITSFEYQTAMQQITGQEQGEADEMLSIFEGIWWKTNYIMLWNWIGYLQISITVIFLFIGIFTMNNNY